MKVDFETLQFRMHPCFSFDYKSLVYGKGFLSPSLLWVCH